MASINVYKVYEDQDFTAADSPVVLDISTDLETISGNGESQYANSLGFTNTGKYDITVEISMDGTTYGDSQTLTSKSTDNINSAGVKKVRITHQGNDTGYQVKAYSRVVGDAILANGGTNATIIDNDTEPVDAYFHRVDSTFTLAADTTASTKTTLNYDFEATTGHGIAVDDYVHLVEEDRDLMAQVKNVATDTITLDRPIDYVYTAANTGGEIVTINLSVDGSTTPQIFKIKSGITPAFIRRVIITIFDASPATMDDGTFGNIAALSNGLVLRQINDYQKTIWAVKTNGDFAQWAYDTTYTANAPQGDSGFRCRMTFGGLDKHGVVLEVAGEDELQWIVQDDLTDLDSITITAQGNKK